MYYCDREMLVTKWACKASLNQRKGRAGRTRPGYVFRLIPKSFYDTLEDNFSPEICRVKLDQIILRLKLYEDKNEFFNQNRNITLEPKLALQKLMDPQG
jgi:HrpA-like RNA helicase